MTLLQAKSLRSANLLWNEKKTFPKTVPKTVPCFVHVFFALLQEVIGGKTAYNKRGIRAFNSRTGWRRGALKLLLPFEVMHRVFFNLRHYHLLRPSCRRLFKPAKASFPTLL